MSKRPTDTNTNEAYGSFAEAPPEKHARTDADTGSTSQARKTALRNGIYLSKVEGLPEPYNENALSLRELISAINPIASIHFNYCCDPEFVVRQYPRRCVQMPISLVVGEGQYPRVKHLAQPYSNVSVHPAPIPFQYCTHHSKLSILESETALHVIISTANVVASGKLTHPLHRPKRPVPDWALKTQAFYHCIAPFRQNATGKEEDVTEVPESSEKTELAESGEVPRPSATKLPEGQPNSPKKLHDATTQGSSSSHDYNWSAFRDDLLEYLDSAFPAKSRYGAPINYWRERIISGNADFSAVKDRIVATVPGRYDKKQAWKFGHLKLRKLLQEKFTPEELKSQKTRIGQFSSIGSLGPNPETWLVDEFLSSLSGQNSMVSASSSLKLIYPTVENVRTSLEGWEAGGSIFA